MGKLGPTVVVLHGGPGLTYDYLLPEWGDLAGVARLAFYDQRGCGRGRSLGVTDTDGLLRELEQVVDVVSPDGLPVILAGSSWGSRLAALYALDHPERVTALILSGVPATVLDRPRWHLVTPGVTPPGFEERDRIGLILRQRSAEVCTDVNEAVGRAHARASALYGLRELGLPILFFADDLFSRAFSDSSSGPQVVEGTAIRLVEGGGHDPWYAYREEFFAAVRLFLAHVSSASHRDPAGRR